MNQDKELTDFYSDIANRLFHVMIQQDYGDAGIDNLTKLTSTIGEIYKNINILHYTMITVFINLGHQTYLSTSQRNNFYTCSDYRNIVINSSKEITIEICNDLSLLISSDYTPPIGTLRNDAIIYQRENSIERIYGKQDNCELPNNPTGEGFFAIKTYKDLDGALEYYRANRARLSDNCRHLKDVWLDENKIFFKSGDPESYLRDSLTDFLSIRLRSAVEVRAEQNVDSSHPVDIKITWDFSNHLALIEIKWLGKSKKRGSNRVTANWSNARAQEGADQLAQYLDDNRNTIANKNTIGYLVVFDARRWQTNTSTVEISKRNGLYYENIELVFDPDHHHLRDDFAIPYRFFMEPVYRN